MVRERVKLGLYQSEEPEILIKGFKNQELTKLETKEEKTALLEALDFVFMRGGKVRLGTENPTPCRLEGHRHCETPLREAIVEPFWIAKYKVTNSLFEIFYPDHLRPPQSPEDDTPVVDVKYGEALSFARALNELTGMDFRLPMEKEWIFAAAPYGWEYPLNEDDPSRGSYHTFGDGYEFATVPVDDPRWPANWAGIHQIGHNVREMVAGHYLAEGHDGWEADPMYCITKGSDYGHCLLAIKVSARTIFDVAERNPRVGFRLAHHGL